MLLSSALELEETRANARTRRTPATRRDESVMLDARPELVMVLSSCINIPLKSTTVVLKRKSRPESDNQTGMDLESVECDKSSISVTGMLSTLNELPEPYCSTPLLIIDNNYNKTQIFCVFEKKILSILLLHCESNSGQKIMLGVYLIEVHSLILALAP